MAEQLREAGSFPLCADGAADRAAIQALREALWVIKGITAPFGPVSLILTGSAARGEACLIFGCDGQPRWLSDLECLAVVAGRKLEPAASAIAHAQLFINDNPANRARGLRIELTPALERHLDSMRVTIFARELAEHGKLLLGPPVRRPDWAKRSAPPRRDGFRLLNNRIVEQLWFEQQPAADATLRTYKIAKLWVELGTSLSLFLGCYASSYQERLRLLEAALVANASLPSELREALISRLPEATAVKLGRGLPGESPDGGRAELHQAAALVWFWESNRLAYQTNDNQGRDVARLLRASETGAQRARDWARLLRRALRSRRLDGGLLRAALSAGSLASAIYGAALLLFFAPGESSNHSEAARLLRYRCADRAALIGRIVTLWNHHLRFAPL